MSDGFVDTAYGRVPGCPECGVIPLAKAYVCEHGVAPAPNAEVSTTVVIEAPALYRRLRDGAGGRAGHRDSR